MSDKDIDQDLEPTAEEREPVEEVMEGEDRPIEDAPADEISADEVPPDEGPAVEKAVKQRGNGVAWLALLVALIAAAAIGYTMYNDWLARGDSRSEEALAGLDSRLSATQDGIDALGSRIRELGDQDSAADATIAALQRELDERVQSVSSLPARMSALESTVASLAGVSKSARDTWLLAEAEYYMQIANAQLQLANNPELATLALGMADERVAQLSDPALIDVRRAISDELAALDIMEKPDIAGTTLTLASLARVVESLPVNSIRRAEGDDGPAVDEQESGVARAWSSMKNAMSGLVKVTPPEQKKLALLTPDGEQFLRNNLALQLQSARLALLRGEQAVFEQALDDTSALLSQYFDNESAQVASAQQTLAEIRGSVFTTSIPDISGSLRLLRQYRTLSESSQ